MSRGLGGFTLAVALLVGFSTLSFAQDPTPSSAQDPPPERAGEWAFAPGFAWGFVSPDDLNERIELDNLLLGTAVEPIRHYKRVSLGVRRGLSEQVSFEMEFGYYWQTVRDGVVVREIDVFPLTAAFVYHLPGLRWFDWSASVGGGLLLEARASGSDPLGGFSASKGGYTVQGALELERQLSKNWSFRVRGTLHWSEASDIPSVGETLDLSGGDVQIGLRIYAR